MTAQPGNGRLPGFRLVTLCGSAGSMHDAMRDSQDILEPMFAARGIDVRPVDLGRWSATTVPALLREIARQQPDGILMQYPTGAFGHALGPVFVGLLQRIAPLMVMLHEFVAAHPLRKAAVGGLLLRADRVGVTAEREGRALVRCFPWLRHRIRPVSIASNIPGRPWHPTQPPRIVHFGQLRPNKGVEEFLSCAEALAPLLPQVRFELVGTAVPGLADYAAAIRARAGQGGITLRSDLGPNKVADLLSTATTALLPYPDGASFRRGTLFAAAACGLPVVTTLGPDTPAELAELVMGVRSADEAASLLRQLLADEAARAEAHRRSLRLDSLYGWDQAVDRYVAVFAELAARRRGPAIAPSTAAHRA